MMNLGEYIPEREGSARVVGKIKTRTKIAIIFFFVTGPFQCRERENNFGAYIGGSIACINRLL